MYIGKKKYSDKFLGKSKLCKVKSLCDFQRDSVVYQSYLGKEIEVMHYHEPYTYNFFVHFKDPELGNKKGNRVIWYDHNFSKKDNVQFDRESKIRMMRLKLKETKKWLKRNDK